MRNIKFIAVVGADQVIRPPLGVELPVGEIEVIVRTRTITGSDEDPLACTRDWLLAFAGDAERHPTELPSDLAEHHDHYAHGKPRP